jgi:hypothetical protein
MLEIKPERVPKFVRLYKGNYMEFTRKWLKENFHKGLVYVPAKAFMETAGIRQNPPMGPTGYSIGHLSMVDDKSMHVVVCFNGGVLWDNGDSREEEYGTMQGFFVMYDLEPEKAKWLKKAKRKKNKNEKRTKG